MNREQFRSVREGARRSMSIAAHMLPGGLLDQVFDEAERGIIAQERIELAKQALVATGYFKPEEVWDDVAPRITELNSALGRWHERQTASDIFKLAVAAFKKAEAKHGTARKSPADWIGYIAEELGELAAEVNPGNWCPARVIDEALDVAVVALGLAEQIEAQLEEATRRTLRVNRERDVPESEMGQD